MDITSSKNIAFAIFTLAPVPLLACVVCILLFIASLFNSGKYNFKTVGKFCFKSILYQAVFLACVVGLLAILWAIQQIKVIPLILLLPISTLFSLFVFVKICWSGRNDIRT